MTPPSDVLKDAPRTVLNAGLMNALDHALNKGLMDVPNVVLNYVLRTIPTFALVNDLCLFRRSVLSAALGRRLCRDVTISAINPLRPLRRRLSPTQQLCG